MPVKKKPAPLFIGVRRSKVLAFAALFLALSALAPYLIYLQLDAQPPKLDNRWLSFPFLCACLTLLLAYFAFDGLRLFHILKALGYRIGLSDMTRLVFINLFVSNITPMATGGGFAQIWYLKDCGVPIGAGTAATSLRTLQAVMFIFIPAPLLLLFMPQMPDSPLGGRAALSLALLATAYIAFFSVVLLRIRWIIVLLEAISSPLTRLRFVEQKHLASWRFRIRREMLRFSRAFRAFFRGPPVHVWLSLAFTMLFLLTLFSFPALLLWGLGYSIHYPTSIGLLLLTTFMMYFAPTPGAAGVAEGVFGLFFASLVNAGDLVLTIVAWRFLTIHLGMLIGLPLTLRAIIGKNT